MTERERTAFLRAAEIVKKDTDFVVNAIDEDLSSK